MAEPANRSSVQNRNDLLRGKITESVCFAIQIMDPTEAQETSGQQIHMRALRSYQTNVRFHAAVDTAVNEIIAHIPYEMRG